MGARKSGLLAGVLAGSLGFVLLGCWAREEKASRKRALEQDMRVVALQLSRQIQGALEKHRIGLAQMVNFWENSDEVTEQEFYEFAARTLALNPLCLRISYLDPDLRVLWVYPAGPNRSLVGFDAKSHPKGLQALLRAREIRKPVLSVPLELVGGAPGFALFAPIFREDRFSGEVVCSFRSADFFGSLVFPELLERFETSVTDSGEFLLRVGDADPHNDVVPPALEEVEVGGRRWQVQVVPRPNVARERLASGRTAVWILGGFLSLLLGAGVGWGTRRAVGAYDRLRLQGEALHQTREELDAARGRLMQAEKLTALGELVAGVAHEINNPLASIMGFTQLALTQEVPPKVRRYLETACSEAERSARIVKNLLTFARKQPPEKKFLGLNGIVEKTLDLRAYHLGANQIEVERDLAPDLPKTMIDFHQIQQVVLNLVNNAEQAILGARRGGKIRLQTRPVGDRIELAITDDGPGIPPEIQSRLFEPFFTTKKEGKGTGLGLSLCFGIVQEHGGEIRVINEPGRGATFLVSLPVVPDAAPGGEAPSSAPPGATKGLRILVIDDEINVQTFFVDLLSSRGHRVDTASDVPEALRKIGANGHDLIISDMKMPRGSGRDVYLSVVERSPHLAKRIIFTTGNGSSGETGKFLRETGNEVLLKPCRIEDIEGAIARAIRA